jgi:hypothetical protein
MKMKMKMRMRMGTKAILVRILPGAGQVGTGASLVVAIRLFDAVRPCCRVCLFWMERFIAESGGETGISLGVLVFSRGVRVSHTHARGNLYACKSEKSLYNGKMSEPGKTGDWPSAQKSNSRNHLPH